MPYLSCCFPSSSSGKRRKNLEYHHCPPWDYLGRAFCAFRAVQRGRLCPSTPRQLSAACVASYGPQAAILRPWPAGRNAPQKVKPPLRPFTSPWSGFNVCQYLYTPAPQNGPQRPTERPAGHKATPAHSTRSKPGCYAIWTPPARQALPGVLQPLRGSRPLSALA